MGKAQPSNPDYPEEKAGAGSQNPRDVGKRLAALRGQGERRLTPEQVGRTITLIGKAARIFVNDTGKPASAHDLRRSFGQRMADGGLASRDLQAIMRHASITTAEAHNLRDKAGPSQANFNVHTPE